MRVTREILIRTATKNSPFDADWKTNSAGFGFNHSFGAGLAHAGRATTLASTWKNLPTQTRRSRQEAGLSVRKVEDADKAMIASRTGKQQASSIG